MRILGIAGSLRQDSHNRRLLRAASAVLPPGAQLDEWENLADIPPFDEDAETAPPAVVQAFLDEIADADALLVATPEYNASVPGALKNAFDWASRPFPDNVLKRKPVAVIGASTGLFGAVWAQAELRKALKASGADVLEDELAVGSADSAFTEDGELADEGQRAKLAEIVGRLTQPAADRVRQAA